MLYKNTFVTSRRAQLGQMLTTTTTTMATAAAMTTGTFGAVNDGGGCGIDDGRGDDGDCRLSLIVVVYK